jgi:nitroreductase
MVDELIRKNRSFRRFHEEEQVDTDTLMELVNLARLSASAGNKQPLKYILVNDPQQSADVFSYLRWAAYLKDWAGPREGQRPPAYIVILGDTKITRDFHCDHGIAAQSILLGAVDRGLGGCILGSIDRDGLREGLSIRKQYDILLVIALGHPMEVVVLSEADGDIKYWRDEKGVHHVPKRPLKELILNWDDQSRKNYYRHREEVTTQARPMMY